MPNKTWNTVYDAVLACKTPETAAGTFVDGLVDLGHDYRSDPSKMGEIFGAIRAHRDQLIKAFTKQVV